MAQQTKPQMKSEICVGEFNLQYYWISFYATPDAASEFQEFGWIDSGRIDGRYTIFVDRRFDLMEVYKYIKEYGK